MSSGDFVLQNIRAEMNDTPNSKLVTSEIPKGAIDGSNKVFYTAYPLLAQVWVTVDGAAVSANGYSLNTSRGMITLTTAPTSSITIDYYFYAFTDNDIQVWIDQSVRDCGYSGIATIASVPEALIGAVQKLALSTGFKAWARKWAEGFSWTIGQETVDKKLISKNYQDMSKQAWNEGIQARDDFYKRYGQRNAPAAGIQQTKVQSYTPPR